MRLSQVLRVSVCCFAFWATFSAVCVVPICLHAQEVERGASSEADDLGTRIEKAPGVASDRPGNPSEPRIKRPDSLIPRRAIASLSQVFDSPVRFRDRNDPGVSSARLATVSTQLRIGFPVYLGEQFKVFGAVNVTRTDLDLERTTLLKDVDLYALSVPVTVNWQLKPDWRILASLAVRSQSDWHELSSDDFGGFGLFVASYRWTKELSISFGVVGSLGFDNNFLFPAFGVVWQPDESLRIALIAPNPKISYAPYDGFHVYAEASFLPGLWHVNEGEISSAPGDYYVDRGGFRAGVGAEVELGWGIWLRVAGGATFGSDLEIANGSRTLVDSGLHDGYYLQWSILWRPDF